MQTYPCTHFFEVNGDHRVPLLLVVVAQVGL